jgi:alkylation response protein AidB-like acyl-CoA dehydrogenase
VGAYELRHSDPTLDDSQQLVRETFATFFAKESPASVVRAAEATGFDRALWERLVEMGITAMGLPAALGGDDATLVDLALVAEEAGRRLAPVPWPAT